MVQGSDCIFKIQLSEDHQPVVCLRSFSLNVLTETIDTTTKGDGQWKAFDYHSLSYTLSLNGIVKVQDADANPHAFDLLALQTQFVEVPYQIFFEDEQENIKILEGAVIITSNLISAMAGRLVDFTTELQGTGSFEIRETLESCETSFGEGPFAVIVGQMGTKVQVNISTINGPWMQIDYILDGGSRFSTYSTEFQINGVPLGDHSLELIPVCHNGIDGISITKNFTMT